MNGLNKVMLIGNIGADPELRKAGDTSVMKISLATTEVYYDRNKVKQERTEWHRVVVWGKQAEGLVKFLTKGMRLFVEGSIRQDSYEDKEGVKRYTFEINARDVMVLERKGDRQESSDRRESPPPQESGNPFKKGW